MILPWQEMSVEEFAGFERILGQQVVSVNGIYWSRVRPLFYRPLLPFQEFSPGLIKPPLLALLGGFKHVVPAGELSNCRLNLLMFTDAATYSLENLDGLHRRQVRKAAKLFTIRPIVDKHEFKQSAYPVYLSFYERTHYEIGSRRTNRDYFSWWADALFRVPHAVVLGGYRNGRLGGVCVSMLVGDTLCYPTVFCDTESMRLQLSGFLLHSVREAVAQCQCAKQIFAGLYKDERDRGVDDFYLQRGCRLLRKPARLQINPVAELVLKRFAPRQYGRLLGRIPDAPQEAERSKSLSSVNVTTERNGSALQKGSGITESEDFNGVIQTQPGSRHRLGHF